MDEFALPVPLRFDREPVPTPGAVRLVFGDSTPVRPGVHLLFSRPPVSTPGPVRLVFGDDGTDPPAPTIPDATLHGAGRITGLRLRIALRAGVRVHAAGRITGLRLRIAARYDVNVQRPTVGNTRARWQDAPPHQVGVRSHYQQTAPLHASTRSHWQDAAHIAVQQREHWGDTAHLPHATAILFERALRLPAREARSLFQEAQSLRHAASTAFQQALRLPVAPSRQRFQETYRDRQRAAETRFQIADLLQRSVAAGMGVAVPLQHTWGTRYQQAWPPRPGIWTPPVVPGPGPCYVPTLPARLVFADPHDAILPARLIFKCDQGGPGPQPEPGVVVPVRKVYIVINSIVLTRLPDGLPLPTESFSLSIDVDSWTWQWSASLQVQMRQHLAPVAGEPVRVQAVINGVPYHLAVESISQDRSFGKGRIAVRGRGIAAVLDAPYAPTLNFGNTADRTAQQLMQDALTVNGVGIGWAVDWGLQDWLVPAGAWSHQGSYISAINTIATSAGGYVQPHATEQILRILPRYPVKPWELAAAAPDVQLPSDVVSVEGIEWVTKPAYNRVHISGQTQGVLAEATRAGTAGNIVAPMVTDALITHADAARQRALAVLADTGAQARVQLTLPVLPETGLILPGKLLRYTDGAKQRTGIVRASSLSWSMPTMRQTLQLETHGSD